MKIEFNSDDELPVNKMIEISSMIIVVRAVFHENYKYPHIFLDDCLYKLWIICDRIDVFEGIAINKTSVS